MDKTLTEIFKENRQQELMAVMEFIADAPPSAIASIVNEIHTVHNNLSVYDYKTRLYRRVDRIGFDGECVILELKDSAVKKSI